MHFAFTDEQEMIADTARAFFAERATNERTRAAMAEDGIDRALWQSFCQELGLGGLIIPEAHGGSGLGMVEFASIAEAAGYHVAALPLLGLATVGRAVVAGGSPQQQAEWLPGLASGEVIASFADSALVPYGARADLFLMIDQDNARLLGRDDVEVTPLTTMDQTRPLARVQAKAGAGEALSDGKAALAAATEGGWICLAAEALGGAQACLDRTVAYAKERIQFGRPIGSFQAYKHRLADMMIAIEEARSAVYWAACAVDEAAADKAYALHGAKQLAADVYFKCAGDMIQLHGGIGFTWEHDAHLFFKRARSIQTLMGEGAAHREAIATMLMGEAA